MCLVALNICPRLLPVVRMEKNFYSLCHKLAKKTGMILQFIHAKDFSFSEYLTLVLKCIETTPEAIQFRDCCVKFTPTDNWLRLNAGCFKYVYENCNKRQHFLACEYDWTNVRYSKYATFNHWMMALEIDGLFIKFINIGEFQHHERQQLYQRATRTNGYALKYCENHLLSLNDMYIAIVNNPWAMKYIKNEMVFNLLSFQDIETALIQTNGLVFKYLSLDQKRLFIDFLVCDVKPVDTDVWKSVRHLFDGSSFMFLRFCFLNTRCLKYTSSSELRSLTRETIIKLISINVEVFYDMLPTLRETKSIRYIFGLAKLVIVKNGLEIGKIIDSKVFGESDLYKLFILSLKYSIGLSFKYHVNFKNVGLKHARRSIIMSKGRALKYMDGKFQTSYALVELAKKYGKLEFILNKTQEICDQAIAIDSSNIRYVPFEFQSKEMCLKVVECFSKFCFY